MTVESLKEYLSIVVDMEQNIYTQRKLISSMEEEIAHTKVPNAFLKPQEPKMQERSTQPPLHPIGCAGSVIGGIGCFIVAFIVLALFGNPVFLLLAFFAPIAWGLYCEEKNKKADENFEREQKEQLATQYTEQLNVYAKEMERFQCLCQRDEEERMVKRQLLEAEKSVAEKALGTSLSCLQTIYDKNIIFPKYRNLVMVCSLYEYICAGRCSTLEGADGAYNILEMEARMDRIILQLDAVIENLGQIKERQYMLYSAVQEGNRRSAAILLSTTQMAGSLQGLYHSTEQLGLRAEQLTTSIQELQKSSELTAYHAERTQKELAYMNRINYLSGKNDDVFWNHPPV